MNSFFGIFLSEKCASFVAKYNIYILALYWGLQEYHQLYYTIAQKSWVVGVHTTAWSWSGGVCVVVTPSSGCKEEKPWGPNHYKKPLTFRGTHTPGNGYSHKGKYCPQRQTMLQIHKIHSRLI